MKTNKKNTRPRMKTNKINMQDPRMKTNKINMQDTG
jgi:hypothetical protein